MNIIPIIKCRNIKNSISFYIDILDFKLQSVWPESGDPSFSILEKSGCEIHLSSHSGDGVFGNAVYVFVEEVDNLFAKYLERGLIIQKEASSPVHHSPIDQSWGTREFYIDDPDGNTIRFGKYGKD